MSPEDIRKQQPGSVVVACRRARGTERLHDCRYCGALIEASIAGEEQIKAGAISACNDCGAVLAGMAAQHGKLKGIARSGLVEEFIASGKSATEAGEQLAALSRLFPWVKR